MEKKRREKKKKKKHIWHNFFFLLKTRSPQAAEILYIYIYISHTFTGVHLQLLLVYCSIFTTANDGGRVIKIST